MIFDDVFGVSLAVERIEEPAVEPPVEQFARDTVGVALRGRLSRTHIEGDPDLGARAMLPNNRNRPAV